MDRVAIVFVHGHMGSVKQFYSLMNLLQPNAQIDQYNISLPGHDGTISDFIRSNRSDWQKCVDGKIAELREKYDGLILVGHSMGGLLLINAAVKCPHKIKAVIAVALPLKIKITARTIKIRIKCIEKAHNNEKGDVLAAREMNGVSGISLLNSYKLLPNTLQFFQVMRETRSLLHKLTVPLTIVHSDNDEIVSDKTLHFAQNAIPNVKVIALKESSHFWFSSQETKIIKEQIDSYCSKEVLPSPR